MWLQSLGWVKQFFDTSVWILWFLLVRPFQRMVSGGEGVWWKFCWSFLFVFLATFASTQAASADHVIDMSTDPGTKYVGHTFTVNLRIDTDGEAIDTISARQVHFNSSLLQLTNTNIVRFFSSQTTLADETNNAAGTKRVDIGRLPQTPDRATTRPTTFAVLTFRVLNEGPGQTTLTYDFDSSPSTTGSYLAGQKRTDRVLPLTVPLSVDRIPPIIENCYPANGSTNVIVITEVRCEVRDYETGIHLGGTTLTVNGITYRNSGSTRFTAQAIDNGYRIRVQPINQLPYETDIPVSAYTEDNAYANGPILDRNSALLNNYSFETEDDNDPPQIHNENPRRNQSNVAVDTNIAFNIRDIADPGGYPGLGVDINSVQVIVTSEGWGTRIYRVDGANQFSFSGNPIDYRIVIDPPSNFLENSVVDVTIRAQDLHQTAPNRLLDSYSFTTTDKSGPTCEPITPERGATSILHSSSIQVRCSDAETGVDISTVSIVVDSLTYTVDGANQFSFSGDAAEYIFTIDPSEDFAEMYALEVIVNARDFNNNAAPRLSYGLATGTGSVELTVDTILAIIDQLPIEEKVYLIDQIVLLHPELFTVEHIQTIMQTLTEEDLQLILEELINSYPEVFTLEHVRNIVNLLSKEDLRTLVQELCENVPVLITVCQRDGDNYNQDDIFYLIEEHLTLEQIEALVKRLLEQYPQIIDSELVNIVLDNVNQLLLTEILLDIIQNNPEAITAEVVKRFVDSLDEQQLSILLNHLFFDDNQLETVVEYPVIIDDIIELFERLSESGRIIVFTKIVELHPELAALIGRETIHETNEDILWDTVEEMETYTNTQYELLVDNLITFGVDRLRLSPEQMQEYEEYVREIADQYIKQILREYSAYHLVLPFPFRSTLSEMESVRLGSVNGMKVESSSQVIPINGDEIVIEGTARENAFITLMIRSDPFMLTAIADEEGKWRATMRNVLPVGEHRIFAVSRDERNDYLAAEILQATIEVERPFSRWVLLAILVPFTTAAGYYLWKHRYQFRLQGADMDIIGLS